MRIVDCFPFFNEKELLQLRINLLYDKVDQFIICDANKTHSGKPKDFTCKKIIKELNLPQDKIHVIEVELPSYEEEDNAWVRERMQRNAASNFIKEDDVCIISDCDEIINSNFIDYYVNFAQNNPNNIIRIPMAFLNCRADLRVYDINNEPIPWAASFICLKHHLKKYTLSDIRESYALSTNHIEFSDIFLMDNGKIEDAGWHFGWMGDKDRLKLKNESFLHWDEVSVDENFKPEENSFDCLGRKDYILKKYPINLLPSEIFEMENIKNFLLPNPPNQTTMMKKTTLLSILEENPFLITDKNTVCYKKHPDKWTWMQHHSYVDKFYEKEFEKYQNKDNVSVCEIGIDVGGSIALISKYFENGSIVGIDISTNRLAEEYKEENFNNVKYYIDDAYNKKFIDSLPNFDIIIDDGPHTFDSMVTFIKEYTSKLNPGGLMVIEDIQDFEWIKYLKAFVPNNFKTEIIDLRELDNVYDSILLSIKND